MVKIERKFIIDIKVLLAEFKNRTPVIKMSRETMEEVLEIIEEDIILREAERIKKNRNL